MRIAEMTSTLLIGIWWRNKFLKHVALDFADDIEQKYDLHAVRYSNYNQDVLFVVSDPARFEQVL